MPIRVLRDGASGLAGLQLQAPRITHHLEIPAADALSLRAGQRAQALPVHRAGAGSTVELLVVEQGLDGEAADRCVDGPLDRVGRARRGARPDAAGCEAQFIGAEVARDGLSRSAMAAAGPQCRAVGAAQAKRGQRYAIVEIHADPVPADGL